MILNKLLNINMPKVLVYQMGKVASKTIFTTLNNRKEFQTFHTHNLNSNYVNNLNLTKKKLGWKILSISPKKTQKLWSKIQKERTVKIVTLIREPISRNISAFFQNLDQVYGKNYKKKDLSQDQLMLDFFKYYPHDIPINWFDNEFNNTLNVNIYDFSFPKQLGASRITTEKYDILIMRYDLDDDLKAMHLNQFFNVNDIKIISKNISKVKDYGDMYHSFKSNIKIPDSYIEEMLDSKYTRHFYEKDEINNLKQKWKHNHI